MVEIKFKEGTQFNRTPLVKYLFERCNISSLKEANEMVKSGRLMIPDRECDGVLQTIIKYGGYITTNDGNGIKLLPNAIDSAQVSVLTKSKKKNVSAIRIVPSEYEGGLAVESVIPIENHVFQTLSNHPSIWHSVIDQMPFVCGITQFQNGEDEHYSLLAARIPVNHNTVDEITSLSKVVHDVHTEIISTIYKFHNLAKKFNPFIDDVDVETRSDSHD